MTCVCGRIGLELFFSPPEKSKPFVSMDGYKPPETTNTSLYTSTRIQSHGVGCPHCGTFTGGAEVCFYSGGDSSRRWLDTTSRRFVFASVRGQCQHTIAHSSQSFGGGYDA
jgi:hypothetical protein